MKLSIVMAIMHVMGRLGVWRPYLVFIQKVLDVLDTACEEEWGPLPLDEMDDMEIM